MDEAKPVFEAMWWRGPAGWAVLACTLLGLMLRILNARGGLWLDEAWSASFARDAGTPLALILNVHHDNNHLLNSWWMQAVGFDAPPMLQRALSIACGTAAIPVAARIAWRWGRRPAIVAALLFAVSPILVIYGSEARGYAPMLLALLIAMALVFEWLEQEDARPPRRAIGWAVLFGGLAQLTMLFGLAALAGAAWLTLAKRSGWRAATMACVDAFWPAGLAMAAAMAAVLVPAWLAPGGLQIGSYTPFTWADWARAIGEMFGFTLGVGPASGIVTIGLFVTGLAFRPAAARGAFGWFALLTIVALPHGIAMLHIGNAGYARYYLIAAGATLLALVMDFAETPPTGKVGEAALLALLALILGLSLWTDARLIGNLRADPLRAVCLIPVQAEPARIWTPNARSAAVVESAGAALGRRVSVSTAPCPAAPYAFVELPPGARDGRVPPPCPGAGYTPVAQGRSYGLSGMDWRLYRRVR